MKSVREHESSVKIKRKQPLIPDDEELMEVVEAAENDMAKPAPPVDVSPALGGAAYQGMVGEFLNGVSKHTEGTDAGVLAHLLPAVAAYIGDGTHLYSGAKHPARINTALVGPTAAGRKGTSSWPVKDLMKVVDEDFWKTRMMPGGLASGEGLIAKVAKDEKRLYMIEQEFASVLAKCKRDGSTLSMIMREAFDSGNLANMTKENSLHTTGAHICITGHITPEELRAKFNHIDMVNGFGNRFLWFYVRSGKELPDAPPIPDNAMFKFAKWIRQAKKKAGRFERRKFSKGAAKKWRGIYGGFRNERPGTAGVLTARGETIVPRLALIYALLDGMVAVHPQHIDAALAVWDYNVQSAGLIFDGKTPLPGSISDTIYHKLANGPMTKTQMWRSGNWPKAELDAALDKLQNDGRIEKVPYKAKGAGRPTEKWQRTNKLK